MVEVFGKPFFFLGDAATTEIYTLSLHDALPICGPRWRGHRDRAGAWLHCSVAPSPAPRDRGRGYAAMRSEEHTSELQSRFDLVCRLLLEKKNTSPGLPPTRAAFPLRIP